MMDLTVNGGNLFKSNLVITNTAFFMKRSKSLDKTDATESKMFFTHMLVVGPTDYLEPPLVPLQ